MNKLYEHLRAKNPTGLPRTEAIQLFLWIYSSKDILPPSLRRESIGKEVLVEAFEQLVRDRLVGVEEAEKRASGGLAIAWTGLVDALLSKQVELDEDFPSRAGHYV